MTRVVVAIDPAVTSGEEADETGIVVAGKDKDGHGYVLADISGRYPPTEWARLAISAYVRHRADRIVAEVNNGGGLVGATLDPTGDVYGSKLTGPWVIANTVRTQSRDGCRDGRDTQRHVRV